MNRIKKQMLENLIISFLRRKDTIVFTNKVIKYRMPWCLASKKNGGYTFEGEIKNTLWRIVFKEFQNINKPVPSPHENYRGFIRMVKSHAKKIANKTDFKYLIDMKELAPDHKYFKSLIDYLGLKENQHICYNEIYKLLERNYREYFYLKNSIKHMLIASERLKWIFYSLILLIGFVFFILRGCVDKKMATGFIYSISGFCIIFRESARNLIDSLIFIFVMHPFSIGDRVFIMVNKEQENLVVSQLNLLSTTFYRWDGTSIQISNFKLLQKSIWNIKRSRMLSEKYHIQVNWDTPKEKIDSLGTKIKDYLKKHSDIFTEYLQILYNSVEDSNKLHLSIWIQFKGNWQNYEMYLEKKSDLLFTINEYLKELKIEYFPLVKRIYIAKTPN